MSDSVLSTEAAWESFFLLLSHVFARSLSLLKKRILLEQSEYRAILELSVFVSSLLQMSRAHLI